MYLMCGDTPVLEFDIDENIYQELNAELLPLQLRQAFVKIPESTSENVNELVKAISHNRDLLIHFLSTRILSLDRKNAKKLLNAYNFSQSQSDEAKTRIAIACKAVSVIDQYWLKEEADTLTWSEVDPKHVSLNQIVAHTMLFGSSLTAIGLPRSPEFTGQGVYAKAWIRKEDGLYLFKRGTDAESTESKIEVSVSDILDCFNVNHVKYQLETYNGAYFCTCKNMVSDDISLVAAEDVYFYCCRQGIDFMEYALSIDKDAIYKMCIVDYLVSNSDRHMMNWGFMMDNQTGKLLCCNPLFDHNNCFDEATMSFADGDKSLVFLGESKKEAAEYAMSQCKFECIAPVTKDMFLTDTMYKSFMQRAVELGLYRTQKPTFSQKLLLNLHLADFQEYVPAELKHPNPK